MRMRLLSISISAAALCLLQGCSKNDASDAQQPMADSGASMTQSPPDDSASTASGPSTAGPAAPAPSDATTASAGGASGAQVFQQYCQTCHGPKGEGDGPAAAGLNPKPASFATAQFRLDPNGNGTKGEIDDIKAVVRDGAAKHGGSPLMAPWPMLTPEQLQAVAEHVKSLSGA